MGTVLNAHATTVCIDCMGTVKCMCPCKKKVDSKLGWSGGAITDAIAITNFITRTAGVTKAVTHIVIVLLHTGRSVVLYVVSRTLLSSETGHNGLGLHD